MCWKNAPLWQTNNIRFAYWSASLISQAVLGNAMGCIDCVCLQKIEELKEGKVIAISISQKIVILSPIHQLYC